MKPLAIDLYCGLGGWAEGFLSEGYRVVGFDIELAKIPFPLAQHIARCFKPEPSSERGDKGSNALSLGHASGDLRTGFDREV